MSKVMENVSCKYPAGTTATAMEPHSGNSDCCNSELSVADSVAAGSHGSGSYRKKMKVQVPSFIDFLGVGDNS